MSVPPVLTTTFTPASSCTVNFYNYPFTYPNGAACAIGSSVVPCNYFHLGVSTSDPACLPSGWSNATTAYYSPGICPVGYTEACSNVLNDQTLATCCPSGYTCQTQTGFPPYTPNICTSAMPRSQAFVYTTYLDGKGEIVSTVTQQQGLNAYGLRISYASSDFPTTSSVVPSSTAPASSPASSGSAPATSTGSADSGSSSGSGGLSTGATIGLGVGVSLGAIALIGALVFLFLSYRKKALAARAAQGADSAEIAMDGPNPPPGGQGGGYAVVPTGSPEPYNLEHKFYGTPPPAPPTISVHHAATPPPAFSNYAEMPGESVSYHASELQGDHQVRS